MNKGNRIIGSFIGFIVLLVTIQCHKDPKTNPCDGVPSSTAMFRTTEFDPSPQYIYTNQDTFMINDYVQFTAVDPNADSYTWKIGDTTITGKSSFYLDFIDKTGTGAIVPVTLTIKQKKSDYQCYSNDDSVKSYSKNIVFLPYNKRPLYGIYKGYNTDSPTDTFTISISPTV